jgi:hypothetical protein
VPKSAALSCKDEDAPSIELIEQLRPLMPRIKARDRAWRPDTAERARAVLTAAGSTGETMAALRVAIGWGIVFRSGRGARGGAVEADYSDALEADAGVVDAQPSVIRRCLAGVGCKPRWSLVWHNRSGRSRRRG